jgi:hypothetical protein
MKPAPLVLFEERGHVVEQVHGDVDHPPFDRITRWAFVSVFT